MAATLWDYVDRDAFLEDLARDLSEIADAQCAPGITYRQALERQDDDDLFGQFQEFLRGFGTDDQDMIDAAQVMATLTLQEADRRGLLKSAQTRH